MLSLVTLFTVFFVMHIYPPINMYNTYLFYKQNFMHYAFSMFLSIEQSTALLLGHNKTPALVGQADRSGGC